MKEPNVLVLELQLQELSKRFRANMRLLDSLIQKDSLLNISDDYESTESASRCFDERLALIRDNFQINQERLDIFKALQNIRHPENRSVKTSVINFQSKAESQYFLNNWKKSYLLREDKLMVEILDALTIKF